MILQFSHWTERYENPKWNDWSQSKPKACRITTFVAPCEESLSPYFCVPCDSLAAHKRRLAGRIHITDCMFNKHSVCTFSGTNIFIRRQLNIQLSNKAALSTCISGSKQFAIWIIRSICWQRKIHMVYAEWCELTSTYARIHYHRMHRWQKEPFLDV